MKKIKKLEKDWLHQGLIDFEYKKYILLDYLNHVEFDFSHNYLYPHLSELIEHYRRLIDIRESREEIEKSTQGGLIGIDLKSNSLIYEKESPENCLGELMSIVDFGIEEIFNSMNLGIQTYENIEADISFGPIGIEPFYKKEGLLLIGGRNFNRIIGFYYKLLGSLNDSGNWIGIQLKYLNSYARGLGTSLNHIKLELLKFYSDLPIPATYYMEFNSRLPLKYTIIPIAKRKLLSSIK